ncbi:TPA: hypothetical protein RTG63_001716, partial [Campylobacter jejuni]|nr:hypothetical protein [Campylobacter jejuni]
MTDLEIIKNYKNGSLSGITLAEHCLFMPVRISGTGLTFRLNEDLTRNNLANYFEKDNSTSLEELVELCKQSDKSLDEFIVYKPYDRNLDDFANDDILIAYQGLPILKNHPHTEKGKPCLLNFYNLQDNNIIGSIIEAYRVDDAIWGLARIYDISLLEFLESKYASTSPAVRSIDIEKDGIIFEKPHIFNHLAFVDDGHWDTVDEKPYNAEKLNIIINDNLLSDKGVLMENSKDGDIKTDSSIENELSKDISKIKEAEKKEAQHFKELSEDHNKIDNEKGEKVEKDLKIDNEVSENSISKD